MQIIKKNWKLILTILGVIVLIALIVYIFVRPQTQSQKTYSHLKLSEFNSNLKYGSDFTYLSSLSFNSVDNNYVYKSNDANFIDEIRNGAAKIGLSNESNNNQRKLNVWTKEGVEDLSEDYVTFDQTSLTFRVKYHPGLNSQNLNVSDVYSYITNFFALPKHEVTIVSNTTSGNANFLSYKVKFNGQPVFFNNVDEIYSTVTLTNGKITQVFMYILPGDTEKKFEIKPLTKINAEILDQKYFQIRLTPTDFTSTSSSGSEQSFFRPARVGSTESAFGYFFLKDSTEGLLYVPVVVLTGNYTDAKDFRGRSLLLVVNQD